MSKKPQPEKLAAKTDNQATEGQEAPTFQVLIQYIKDLSFENPNAPQSFQNQTANAGLNISVNVNARQVAPTDYEVELQLDVKAGEGKNTLLNLELLYAGIFRIANIPQEMLQPLVLIECPRLLFPFARQIVADTSRNGGFPPVMIDPIDFAGLYQQRLEQEQAAQEKKN